MTISNVLVDLSWLFLFISRMKLLYEQWKITIKHTFTLKKVQLSYIGECEIATMYAINQYKPVILCI